MQIGPGEKLCFYRKRNAWNAIIFILWRLYIALCLRDTRRVWILVFVCVLEKKGYVLTQTWKAILRYSFVISFSCSKTSKEFMYFLFGSSWEEISLNKKGLVIKEVKKMKGHKEVNPCTVWPLILIPCKNTSS